MVKKETFAQDELGLIATSLNATIRELEAAVEQSREDATLQAEYQSKLSDTKQLQEKAFRMYKFK